VLSKTAKEVFARCLHEWPARRQEFVAVVRGDPQDWSNPELRRRAPTPAHNSRPAASERANGGTLLLTRLATCRCQQADCARAAEREIERLGDQKPRW
jgi:DNA-binding NtrC family response regulator